MNDFHHENKAANKDETTNKKKTLVEKLEAKFEKNEKRREKAEEHTDGVSKALKIVVLCLCLVSFFATSEGLRDNVFIGYPLRAYFVSFALQTVIFVLSLKLPEYISLADHVPDAMNKLRAMLAGSGTTSPSPDDKKAPKTKKYRIAFLLLYCFSVMGSSFFGYVFLSNQAYRNNSQWHQDADKYLEEQYHSIILSAEDYIGVYERHLQFKLADSIGLLSNMVGGSADEISVDVGGEWKSNMISDLDGNLGNRELNDLAEVQRVYESMDSNGASLLRESIKNRIGELKGTLENINSEIEWLRKREEHLTDQLLIATISRPEIEKQLATVQEEIKQLSEQQKQFRDILSLYERLLSFIEANSISSVSTEIVNILTELKKDNPSIDEIENNTDNLYKTLLGSLATLNNNETFTERLKAYSELEDALKQYQIILKSGAQVSTYKEESISNTISFFNNADFNETEWHEYWMPKFDALKQLLIDVPNFTDNTDDTSLSADERQVLVSFSSDKMLNEINNATRLYLSNISAMERAFGFLISPHRLLAVLCLIIALYLDVASLIIGFFLYFRSEGIRISSLLKKARVVTSATTPPSTDANPGGTS